MSRHPIGYRLHKKRNVSCISWEKSIKYDSAVSPVIGIMLLITITLILSAIISGMTGGIAQKQEKPPQLFFEASAVIYPEAGDDSFFDIRVVSASQGIPTRDLKLITEWREDTTPHRKIITPLSKNVGDNTYPVGYNADGSGPSDFGNFTLLAGTRMNANGAETGSLNATLSDDWGDIPEGTPIKIQFIHVPSGAVIAEKEITTEA